ncbi:hypothetical protein, partial [Arenimonas composti]
AAPTPPAAPRITAPAPPAPPAPPRPPETAWFDADGEVIRIVRGDVAVSDGDDGKATVVLVR